MPWQYVLTLLALFFIPAAVAQDIKHQAEALALITQTARDICDNIKLEGSSARIEAEGEVEAGLSSLLRQLADLGISGSVSGEAEEYSNLKQQDLAQLAIKNPSLLNQSNCRLTIFNSLKSDLLSAAPTKPSTTTSSAPDDFNLAQGKSIVLEDSGKIFTLVFVSGSLAKVNIDGGPFKILGAGQAIDYKYSDQECRVIVLEIDNTDHSAKFIPKCESLK